MNPNENQASLNGVDLNNETPLPHPAEGAKAMGNEGFPNVVRLRDGSELAVGLARPEDGAALLEFYRGLPEEDRMVLKDDVTTADWLARFLSKLTTGEAVSLVGQVRGRIVGEATLYRSLHGWSRHVGEIRINVAPAHRRHGLGVVLVGGMVKIAVDLGLEKLVAQMVEHQVAACRTFAKLGFHQEAELHHHVTDIRGIKRNLLIYANDVSHVWAAMESLMADFQPHQGD